MRILIAGFEGRKNSAQILLERLWTENKIYLKNDREESFRQVRDLLEAGDTILLVGQKPVIKDKICIELEGKLDGEIRRTEYSWKCMKQFFEQEGIAVRISRNAGNSYCNYLYFSLLDYIEKNQLDCQTVFIHIPYWNNMSDFELLVRTVDRYIRSV